MYEDVRKMHPYCLGFRAVFLLFECLVLSKWSHYIQRMHICMSRPSFIVWLLESIFPFASFVTLLCVEEMNGPWKNYNSLYVVILYVFILLYLLFDFNFVSHPLLFFSLSHFLLFLPLSLCSLTPFLFLLSLALSRFSFFRVSHCLAVFLSTYNLPSSSFSVHLTLLFSSYLEFFVEREPSSLSESFLHLIVVFMHKLWPFSQLSPLKIHFESSTKKKLLLLRALILQASSSEAAPISSSPAIYLFFPLSPSPLPHLAFHNAAIVRRPQQCSYRTSLFFLLFLCSYRQINYKQRYFQMLWVFTCRVFFSAE